MPDIQTGASTISRPADTASQLGLRELELSFTSPFYGFETTTSLWYTATQASGFLGDQLGSKAGGDKYVASRIGLGLFTLWSQWLSTYYAHEAAHNYQELNDGASHPGSIDLTDWDWKHLAPRWRHAPKRRLLSGYEDALNNAAGLNQQELNSVYQFGENSLRGRFRPDEGMAFFFNDIADVAYHTFYGEHPGYDINDYLATDSHEINKTKFVLASAISALGTYHNWESIGAFIRYLHQGDRSDQEMFHWQAGEVEVLPPNFEVYPYPFGLFVNATLPLRNIPRDQAAFFLHLGADVLGEFDRFRIGAEMANIRLGPTNRWYVPWVGFWGALNANPPVSKSSTTPLAETVGEGYQHSSPGFSFSAGGQIGVGGERLGFSTQASYDSGDLIENAIKGRDPGVRFLLSSYFRY